MPRPLSKNLLKIRLINSTIFYLVVALIGVLGACATNNNAIADNGIVCQFDPSLNPPNPLGNRAFITVSEIDGNTHFVLEQFPERLGSDVAATIELKRTLIFYDLGISAARTMLREQNQLYNELVGYEDPDGYSPYDELMKCDL